MHTNANEKTAQVTQMTKRHTSMKKLPKGVQVTQMTKWHIGNTNDKKAYQYDSNEKKVYK